MPRSYRYISHYEKEIMKLQNKGICNREICEMYGFSMKQLKNFITRYNKKQRIIESGQALNKKGRPCKKTRWQFTTINTAVR